MTDRYLNVTQRYPTLPQRDLNVTSTWPQRHLNVTHRYLNVTLTLPIVTQRDLNVILKLIQIYQKRDLNVTFTYRDTQGVY